MPTVTFVSNEGETLVVDAAPGSALADICDQNDAPIPFSCRSASCGTCRMVVLEGGDQLQPPEDEELEILDVFGNKPNQRLACCAKLNAAAVSIRVRPVADFE